MEIREIAKAFDKLSPNYDLISYIMSLGVTIYWRIKLVNESTNIINKETKYILDLCTGTGDIALSLYKKSPNKNIKIIGFDISFGMLKKLKQKAKDNENIIPILGDISKMPFKDKIFDLSTMSFGARSLMESDREFKEYFMEIYRVVKVIANLETSQPKNKLIKFLYYAYLYFVIIILGSIFFPHYNKEYYRTIISFPGYEKFSEILKEFGFKEVKVIPLFFGMACIHLARD